MMRRAFAATLFAMLLVAVGTAAAQSPSNTGVVVIHGKGGSPTGLVKSLADGLESKGYRVANLEMPWSGKREYDKNVSAAEQEVDAALARLRGASATKLFVAGHSQGAVFALYYAIKHPLDGLVSIAPGGNVATRFYQQKVGASVGRARNLAVSGKADERGEFDEFEGGKGTTTVHTTGASYLTWFDPDGAMNQINSSQVLLASLPVLHLAPTSDYPALIQAKQDMFGALSAHPFTKLYEPEATHRTAPTATLEEIASWIAAVAARK